MSRLFEIFTSEYVQITLKNATGLVVVNGFFTEEDDEFYYLGYEQDHISAAIRKADVFTVEISDPNEELAEALNEMVDENSGIN